MNKKLKIKNKLQLLFILLLVFFTFYSSLFNISVLAQSAISLSVSPPILEVMIQPGKEVRQTYVIQNNGGETVVTPKVVYFNPTDNTGNVELTEKEAPSWIKFDKEPFKLKFEEQKTFNVVINPPENEEEIDHYLTFVLESKEGVDLLGQTSSFYKTEIGSNILITISKDGQTKKSAKIVSFTAPKIIDSVFGKIEYSVEIRNNGNNFWKPIGKISTNTGKALKLAPQNILSGLSRKISCVENEELKSCFLNDKPLFGNVISTLEFSIEDDSKIHQQVVKTLAFPFSILTFVLVLLTLIRLRGIFKLWRRKR